MMDILTSIVIFLILFAIVQLICERTGLLPILHFNTDLLLIEERFKAESLIAEIIVFFVLLLFSFILFLKLRKYKIEW